MFKDYHRRLKKDITNRFLKHRAERKFLIKKKLTKIQTDQNTVFFKPVFHVLHQTEITTVGNFSRRKYDRERHRS